MGIKMKSTLLKNNVCISFNTVIKILCNFIFTRVLIQTFGSEINGFYNSTLSLMGYLNIAEAGVGSATIYALYSPVVNKKYNEINRILSFTNLFFKKIAIYLCIILAALSVIYPYIVKGFNNNFYGSLMILAYGSITVTEYFFDGKYKLLLDAEQLMYVRYFIQAVINLVTKGLAISLCILGFSLPYVLFALCLEIPIRIVIYNIVIKKKHTWINLHVSPDYSIKAYSKDIFIQKIATLIFTTTDVLLISIVIGAKEVSVYAVYNMIINGMNNIMSVIAESPVNLLGKYYVKEKDKFRKLYKGYELLCIMMATIIAICYFILITPFISLYTQGISDIKYDNSSLAVLMGINFILCYYRSVAATTLNAAGIFKEGKKIFLLEAVINIIASIIFLNLIGYSGVVLGSICARIVSTSLVVRIIYKKIIETSLIVYLKRILPNIILIILTFVFVDLKDNVVNRWTSFFILAAIVGFISFLIVVGINFVINKKMLSEIKK